MGEFGKMSGSRAPGRKRWRAGDAQTLVEALVRASSDPVFVKNAEGVYLTANQAMAEAMQLATTTALLGCRDEDILPAAAAQTIRSSDQLVMETRAPLAIEESLGGRRFVARKFPWEDSKGRLIGIVGMLEDVAGAGAVPNAALDSQTLHDLTQKAGRIGFFEWYVETGVVRLSPNFLALDALTPFDGRYETWIDLLHRDDRSHVTDVLETAFRVRGSDAIAEFRIVVPPDGATKWIEARYAIFYDAEGKPTRVVGVNLDITERKRAMLESEAFAKSMGERAKEHSRALEAESEARRRADASLRQMQRMEAVGQLTGGVAHDFNNLLTIILGGLDIIGAHIPSIGASPAAARITRGRDMAMQGARRAATLTQRLLAFSRQQPLDPKPLDPNKLVAGMSEFLRRTLGETVALESVLAAGLWKACVDFNELENAILNLAVNARDAMPRGGKLTIETANCHLDEAYVAALPEPLKPGQYILIAIADTGLGMTKATLERVFEPFFTTKEIGKGTGLGLSQVYGFVRQSNGHVKIYSEVGEGSTVKIYLPRYLGSDAEETEFSKMHGVPRAIGAETILVVEDDDALREYTVEILTDLGYHVLAASGAAMALDILDRVNDVDLLFTDIVMPGGANGRELADEALHRKSDLKVLFTTGYTRNAIVHHGRLDQGVQMIGKPFSFDQLAAKVRAMLSEC